MEVLLLTDEADLESALPELESFAQSVQRAPLDDPGAAKGADADVAIIDARADLAAARRVCRRLTTSAPALAVVAVVAPANFVAVDGDWIFDDVLLNAAGGAELQARLRLAITRRRSTLAGTLQFGDLVLHPASYTASLGDRDLGLTLTEFKLMNSLCSMPVGRSPGLGSCVRCGAMSAMVAFVPSMFTYDDCAQSSEPSTNR